MSVEVLEGQDLTESQRQELIDFEVGCFGTEEVRELRQSLYFAPTYHHLLIRKGGKLVSYLRTILREASWQDKTIMVGGIGSVSTKKEERGQGYASKILEKAMELLREGGADIVLLETNIEKGKNLYGKVGFIPAGKPYTYNDINGELHAAKAKDVMIAPGRIVDLVKEITSSSSPLLHVGNGGW